MYINVHYSDLNEVLGSKWIVQGLKVVISAVFLDTVRFYLRKSSKNDYISTEDELAKKVASVFMFIRRDCVSSDFGKVYSMQ